MGCPKCGCKVTYELYAEDFREDNDYEMNRCSACNSIFYAMDEPEDDDYSDIDYEEDCRLNRGQG